MDSKRRYLILNKNMWNGKIVFLLLSDEHGLIEFGLCFRNLKSFWLLISRGFAKIFDSLCFLTKFAWRRHGKGMVCKPCSLYFILLCCQFRIFWFKPSALALLHGRLIFLVPIVFRMCQLLYLFCWKYFILMVFYCQTFLFCFLLVHLAWNGQEKSPIRLSIYYYFF